MDLDFRFVLESVWRHCEHGREGMGDSNTFLLVAMAFLNGWLD